MRKWLSNVFHEAGCMLSIMVWAALFGVAALAGSGLNAEGGVIVPLLRRVASANGNITFIVLLVTIIVIAIVVYRFKKSEDEEGEFNDTVAGVFTRLVTMFYALIIAVICAMALYIVVLCVARATDLVIGIFI